MRHTQLIHIAHTFGYKTISFEGLCKGYSAMWIQAVCSGDLKTFNERMGILEQFAQSPEKLFAEINHIKDLVRKDQNLTELQYKYLEIPVFFDGISLYLDPGQNKELFNNKWLKQSNEADISAYVQSKALEDRGGLFKAFTVVNQYDDLDKLTHFLDQVSNELKDKKDIGIDLSANGHSVAVRVLGQNKFQLIDTNNLDEADEIYSSQELAEKLDSISFSNNPWYEWFTGFKPLIMSTSIFTNQMSISTLRYPPNPFY